MRESIIVTTTGEAGSATGSSTSSSLYGLLNYIEIKFLETVAATTNVNITVGDETILNVLDSNSSAIYLPRKSCHDTSGDVIADVYDKFPLFGSKVSVAVTDSTAGTILKVTIGTD